MKPVTDRLWNAVVEVARLRHPSVGEILRRRGFGYEAGRMDEFIAAFDDVGNVPGEAGGGDESPPPPTE